MPDILGTPLVVIQP